MRHSEVRAEVGQRCEGGKRNRLSIKSATQTWDLTGNAKGETKTPA